MDRLGLIGALSSAVPTKLAEDLAEDFLDIRQDVATRTLGRAAPGKFVETLVQILQHLETGTFEEQPNVEGFLKGLESRQSTLPDGLRICASRVARGMYALRSKRSIAHKGAIDPQVYDLRFLYAGAQWVLAELLATIQDVPPDEAGRLVEEVQVPVGGLVESLHGRRVVLAELKMRDEALVVLMSHYPDPITPTEVVQAMERRHPQSVRNVLNTLWREKLLHKVQRGRVVLTQLGMRRALAIAKEHLE